MARSSGLVFHCVGISMMIVGDGALENKLISANFRNIQDLADLTLQPATDRISSVLANFKSQYIQAEVGVDAIDDYFLLSNLYLLVKPFSTGFPQ